MQIPFCWDWRRWSLYRVQARYPDGRPLNLIQLFALRCADCRRWTLGCKDHWICGLCERCRTAVEDGDPTLD
jgi:hypothetical protein